jgi:Cu+-exporting ATPase
MTVNPEKAAGKSEYRGETIYFCAVRCKNKFDASPESFLGARAPAPSHAAMQAAPPADSSSMAKDLVCGMVVEKDKSLKKEAGGRTYYFCSEGCLQTFSDPEEELRRMKKRVSVALFGVLALAVLRVAAFMGLAAGATVLTWAPVPALPWFTWGVWLFILVTPVQFIGGWSFYVGAYNAVKNWMINMDMLIALGTTTAYAYSVVVIFAPGILPIKIEERDVYFEVSAVIIAFVLLGKYMEETIKKRSSAAVRKLMDLKPRTACVIRNNVEMEVPAETVQAGDTVVVRPGEQIAADGTVVFGSSTVDEKMITGESMPVDKGPGDEVIGATINKSGSFKFRAKRVGLETTLSQIIKMVEEAQASSAPIQRIADRVAAYFVVAVVAVAFLSFFGWWAMGSFPDGLLSFIAVLIIACPCALGIATPAALMVGVGKGAEAGILIRGGEFLERAEKLDTIVFDKTGTLTKGEPSVTDIIGVDVSDDEVLRLAAIVEKGSEHPLGRAIVESAKMKGMEIPDGTGFIAVPGHGVKITYGEETLLLGNRRLMETHGISALALDDKLKELESQGKTAVIVALIAEKAGRVAGVVGVADTIKESSLVAVSALKKEGVEVIMLTGDNERTARAVAKSLGIEKVIAGVVPSEKAGVIKGLKAEGKVVAMVGDGINDAPALAVADIGIAIGSGSDVAKETGGIILVRDDVRDVVKGIRLSKATMRKIKQNLFWAFIYNSIGITVAALGLLNPIIAAAAMALSSLSVVINSSTLKMIKLEVE